MPLIFVVFICLFNLNTARAEQYARVLYSGTEYYGLVKGDQIQLLEGGLFPPSPASGQFVSITDVMWLPPTNARKVFAVGKNFASHRSSRASAPPPIFLKLPSALTGHNREVTLPADATNLHFEGEMVLVIGKFAKNINESEAHDYIFGITAGNDLTERSWQRKDLQWIRAKASDGFGPVGPVIERDINYNDALITTRLNGKVVQQESTKNMIHSPAKVVSHLSQYFSLEPGDLIFMGTPGRTKSMQHNDIVTVDIEGVGTLSNKIIQQ